MTAEPADRLQLLRTASLTSVVREELERMILDGRAAAGSRLNEQALAARLGVSRGPVREAIRGLEHQGLVITVVNQGSYVRKLSAEEALELYDLRALLTGEVCATLATTRPAAAEARLAALVAAMEAAAAQDDAPGYYALNIEFHAALFEHGAGARAQRIHADLGKELTLFRRRALVQPEKMRESNAEHAAILAALRAGDAAAARLAGEAHIRGGKRRFGATSAPPG
ncbi:GntR family transcriptional regulator [Pseudoroseomonas cervicalis]|uniref:GntR family transcriptional regulator n=1 Tax=Teichococcus cervicalis TaxID=204525 RepID=UPI0022F162A1|nr:GntR family transcriptional regulator [Pseudoroseomonas cervicalis]WBV45119.1 GntR family transcriptional regulator [Pseudoroseomonas cervicalis]